MNMFNLYKKMYVKNPILTIIVGTGLGAVGAFFAAPVIATMAGAAGLLGAASTGTAISTLSGAALTNASLAAIGGGALSAGGGGMAFGTAVITATGSAAGRYATMAIGELT